MKNWPDFRVGLFNRIRYDEWKRSEWQRVLPIPSPAEDDYPSDLRGLLQQLHIAIDNVHVRIKHLLKKYGLAACRPLATSSCTK